MAHFSHPDIYILHPCFLVPSDLHCVNSSYVALKGEARMKKDCSGGDGAKLVDLVGRAAATRVRTGAGLNGYEEREIK